MANDTFRDTREQTSTLVVSWCVRPRTQCSIGIVLTVVMGLEAWQGWSQVLRLEFEAALRAIIEPHLIDCVAIDMDRQTVA